MDAIERAPFGGPALTQQRRLVTSIPGPRSLELFARKEAAVANGLGAKFPAFVAAAGGGIVLDVDGNSLIDFGSGIAVTSVGNSAEAVVERVSGQLGAYTHACFIATPYEPYVEVCELLAEVTPGTHAKRSALFNSGSEAIEHAVKFARAHTRRQAVVSFDRAYHGRTNLAMALTSVTSRYTDVFGPFAPEIYRAPMAYPYRWPGGAERCAAEAPDAVLDAIRERVDPSRIAALVIEPIQGEGGVIEPPAGFLPRLAEFCAEHGIVFVADEVQTGFCRTGDWFACDHEGVVPDLIVTAKGIAGGLPLAAVTGRAEIMDAAKTGLGGTFNGNPLACAAALGAVHTMREQDLAGVARRIGSTISDRIAGLARRHRVIGDVRGRGAMIGVELVEPGGDSPSKRITTSVVQACQREGLIVLTAGKQQNVLRLLPPLVMPDHLLAEGLDIVERAFARLP
jgi:4-aminobutyrate aminotransferase/(S)-3-amino-2-methylpropionate transaminase